MVTPQSMKKNYDEASRLLGVLAQCNMWASGIRIENLPPSHVEKIEVQMVQKNYVELSEVRIPHRTLSTAHPLPAY